MVETKIECPEGVVLDTSRVGETLDSVLDAEVGETIEFVYDGGSAPGETRTVLVQSKDRNGIAGITLERDGAFRRYNVDLCEYIDVVAPFVESSTDDETIFIRFDVAVDRLSQAIDGDKLASLYKELVSKDAVSVVYDANKGGLVVTMPEVKLPENHVESSGPPTSITFKNRVGEKFTQFIHRNGVLGYLDEGDRADQYNVSPDQLSDALARFLSRDKA